MTMLITLDSSNRSQLADIVQTDSWIVACLCAEWCDVCTAYRPGLAKLAALHPDKLFIWIDIEDQADLIGDIEVDNFPTLLIQRGDHVAFFGTMLPNISQLERMLQSFSEHAGNTPGEAEQVGTANAVMQHYNLRRLVQSADASTRT